LGFVLGFFFFFFGLFFEISEAEEKWCQKTNTSLPLLHSINILSGKLLVAVAINRFHIGLSFH
jgi:hypothetical protein